MKRLLPTIFSNISVVANNITFKLAFNQTSSINNSTGKFVDGDFAGPSICEPDSKNSSCGGSYCCSNSNMINGSIIIIWVIYIMLLMGLMFTS